MDYRKKWLILLIVITLLIPQTVLAKSQEYITIQAFAKRLETVIGKGSLIRKKEFINRNSKITRLDTAVLANRADEILNGSKYDVFLYAQVKNKKRITGLSKVPKSKIIAVQKVYIKGIMVGYSNGKYSQNRNFKAKAYLSKAEAESIILRLKDKKRRKRLSPDGQLIRTTKLPSNYRKYDYILASFPNSFYEKRFSYEDAKYSKKPVELLDYARPARVKKMKFKTAYGTYGMQDIIDKNLNQWVQKVEANLVNRLNFNYQTVGEKWITGLRNTYPLYGDVGDQGHTNKIRDYLKEAQKNKVIITSSKVVVEPSTLYFDAFQGYYLRCYVKFKVSANTFYTAQSGKQYKLIYGQYGFHYLPHLKKNAWYEGVFDIALRSTSATDTGDDYAIGWDFLAE